MSDFFASLVSIVIPVYNGANYMREAIDSALAQTYPNCEVIVVNDGSRDEGKTLEIAKSYGDSIRLVDKPNGGVATALNAGIEAMKGDYFSWLSHDDIYPANKIEKQIEFLRAVPGKNIVLFGDYQLIDENGTDMGVMSSAGIDSGRMLFELYSGQSVHGCTLLVPKSVFEKVGVFRTDLPTTQDYDMWLRIAQVFPFARVPGIMTLGRQHAEQGSRQKLHEREVLKFRIENLALLSPQWMDGHYTKAELRGKYKLLLARLSAPGLWPIFSKLYRQALYHLTFSNFQDKTKFKLNVMSNFVIRTSKERVRHMVPLRIKNVLRRQFSRGQRNASASKLDFVHIYQNNKFGSDESRSGGGSTLEQTEKVRAMLPGLLREFAVRTFLDTPCGDFHWMQHVDLDGIHYIGGDIVPELIAQNNDRFHSEDREFLDLNIISSDLPKADLIFCRDCLVHMSFEDGLNAISNFKRSGATYLLTTTFTNRRDNKDLFGIWRPLNLQKPPYSFPAPLRILNEGCTEGRGKFKDKSLGLWKLADLQS